ncbi:unnamed protein product [Ectocarpus sp. 12 AP-2014]
MPCTSLSAMLCKVRETLLSRQQRSNPNAQFNCLRNLFGADLPAASLLKILHMNGGGTRTTHAPSAATAVPPNDGNLTVLTQTQMNSGSFHECTYSAAAAAMAVAMAMTMTMTPIYLFVLLLIRQCMHARKHPGTWHRKGALLVHFSCALGTAVVFLPGDPSPHPEATAIT